MACKDHPNYGGLRKPRTDCKGCWDTYNENQSNKGVNNEPDKKEKSTKTSGKSEIPKIQKPRKNNRGTNGSGDKGKPEEVTVTTLEKTIIEPEVSDDSLKKELEEKIQKIIEEVSERKLAYLRSELQREMSMQWEHIFITDDIWHPNMLTELEKEGWQWMSHSWPLAEKGIIPGKDYQLLKRLKVKDNKPIPDFENPKIIKKYCGIVPQKETKKK